MDKKSLTWINFAKLIAILGVLFDHCYTILYTDLYIIYVAYFNVSLFILLMGVTSYFSFEKTDKSLIKKVISRFPGLVIPYVIATFVHHVAANRGFILINYLKSLIFFTASGPYYYVSLYLQLLLISPLIFYVVKLICSRKYWYLYAALVFMVLTGFAFLTTNYTNIFDIFGGGGKLFGGTYIILLYFGMLFASKYREIKSIPGSLIILVFCLVLDRIWTKWYYKNNFHLDDILPFERGLNPPSISLIVHSVLVLFILFSLGMLIKNINSEKLSLAFLKVSNLGKHTLYIFLYHKLFLDYVFPWTGYLTGMQIDNIWVKRIVYFGVMICGSLVFEYLSESLVKFLKKVYMRANVSDAKSM